jgi:transcriptional regulator with XRE-family HTH domain
VLARLKNAEAAPSGELENYLDYFVTERSQYNRTWRLSAGYARIANPDTVVGFDERRGLEARNSMLRRIAEVHYEVGEIPALPRMLSFLRVSAGVSQSKFGRLLGYSQTDITQFERGSRTPNETTINAYQAALGFDDRIKSILVSKIPEARAFASHVSPFSDLFTELVEHYGGDDAFCEKTGLRGYISDGPLAKLKNAEAAPSEELGHYLDYFLPQSIAENRTWRLSAHHARAINPDNIAGFDEGRCLEARNSILRHIAEARYAAGEIPALPRMLRLLRVSAGLTQPDLRRLLRDGQNLTECFEQGSATPSEKTITAYQAALRFDDTIKSALLSKIPEARVFASQTPPFPGLVSRIVGDRSNQQFLRDSRLEGIVTPAGVEKWKNGEAVPSTNLGYYLAYFASETGVKLDVYRRSLDNARVSVTEVVDLLDHQTFREIRYATLKDLAEMEGPTALPKMLRFVRVAHNQSLLEFAAKLGMDFRNLKRLETQTLILPSAETLQRIRQEARLTPDQDFLLRHTAIDLYLSRSSERGKPGPYILQIPLLLGHDPDVILVQDISSGTRQGHQTLQQRDNAKLLQLIEARILRKFKTRGTVFERLVVSKRSVTQPELWQALGHPDSTIPVKRLSEPSGFNDEPRDAQTGARQQAYADTLLLRGLIREKLIKGELETESTSSLRPSARRPHRRL